MTQKKLDLKAKIPNTIFIRRNDEGLLLVLNKATSTMHVFDGLISEIYESIYKKKTAVTLRKEIEKKMTPPQLTKNQEALEELAGDLHQLGLLEKVKR